MSFQKRTGQWYSIWCCCCRGEARRGDGQTRQVVWLHFFSRPLQLPPPQCGSLTFPFALPPGHDRRNLSVHRSLQRFRRRPSRRHLFHLSHLASSCLDLGACKYPLPRTPRTQPMDYARSTHLFASSFPFSYIVGLPIPILMFSTAIGFLFGTTSGCANDRAYVGKEGMPWSEKR